MKPEFLGLTPHQIQKELDQAQLDRRTAEHETIAIFDGLIEKAKARGVHKIPAPTVIDKRSGSPV